MEEETCELYGSDRAGVICARESPQQRCPLPPRSGGHFGSGVLQEPSHCMDDLPGIGGNMHQRDVKSQKRLRHPEFKGNPDSDP
ncbi:hypothetical protein ACLOJK_034733 [Asimina triloba]